MWKVEPMFTCLLWITVQIEVIALGLFVLYLLRKEIDDLKTCVDAIFHSMRQDCYDADKKANRDRVVLAPMASTKDSITEPRYQSACQK